MLVRTISFIGAGVFLSIFGLAAMSKSSASKNPNLRAPVVVELFTSEGCSSCPSADILLARLVKNANEAGIPIIGLEEHVDYWNHLGWRDPFSDEFFSRRQSAYSERFRLNEVYTPQMVVDGRVQFLGNDESAALDAINKASSRQKAMVALNYANGKLAVDVSGTTADAEVWVAVTEDGLASSVARGENSGRVLEHTGVVREIQRIGQVKAGAHYSTQYSLPPSSNWKTKNLHWIAFVEAPRQGGILGSAQITSNSGS